MNANDVIKIAENEVGYLEKASDKDLDWKTENAGSKNYTLTSTYITGYGRPRYDENTVMYAEPTVNLKLNSRSENVKWLQSYLVKW